MNLEEGHDRHLCCGSCHLRRRRLFRCARVLFRASRLARICPLLPGGASTAKVTSPRTRLSTRILPRGRATWFRHPVAINDAVHVFPEASVEIFSNDIGCFDRNRLEDFQQSGSFDYFAGDSQTWGYASDESKFPTVDANEDWAHERKVWSYPYRTAPPIRQIEEDREFDRTLSQEGFRRLCGE